MFLDIINHINQYYPVWGIHQGMRVFCCLSAGSHLAFSLSAQVHTPLQWLKLIQIILQHEVVKLKKNPMNRQVLKRTWEHQLTICLACGHCSSTPTSLLWCRPSVSSPWNVKLEESNSLLRSSSFFVHMQYIKGQSLSKRSHLVWKVTPVTPRVGGDQTEPKNYIFVSTLAHYFPISKAALRVKFGV